MKHIVLLAGCAALVACTETPTQPDIQPKLAVVTAPGQNKLQCFDGPSEGSGYGGSCTLKSNGAKGPATLSNTSSNPLGDYSGVYTLESTVYGQLLTNLTQLSYHYTGSAVPTPTDLSYNIPINADADALGTTDAYAFVDAYYCRGVDGVVNITTDAACGIYYGGTVFYPNWAAFVAAYPGAKVATDYYVFIVAERVPSAPAAVWTVSNVKFGKGGK